MTDRCRWHLPAAIAAFVACLAVGQARPANAHASLLGATPADGVTIFAPPQAFRLEFNEPVSPLVMRLVRPDGGLATLGDAQAANNAVTIAAPPMSQQGTYILSWRVISADGHPVSGVVSFALGHPSSGVAAPSVEGAGAVHVAIWIAQFIFAVGLFVGVGGAVFAAWLAVKGAMPGSGIFSAAMVGGVASAIVSLPFQGLDALGEPLSNAGQGAVWIEGFRTSWGSTVVIGLVALTAGLLVFRTGNRAAARSLGLLGLAGVGLAFVASGHGSTIYPALTIPAIFLHAVCVTAWVGSLLPLAMVVRAGDNAALERFSQLVPLPLVVLIATGIALAAVSFDRPDALWTTDYGLVLAAKLGVVLAMLALAAVNRYLLVPRLAISGTRRLVAIIATEFALAVVILGIVGLWRFTPPPRALAAAETTYIHFHSDRAMAQIEVKPERDRGAAIGIAVTDGDLRPIAAKEVTLVIWNPDAGIEPIRRNAAPAGDAQWRVEDIRIPVAGVWRMRVEILVNDFEKIMLEDNVELPRAP